MRTPKVGDSYQVCVHLESKEPKVERHFWYVPGKPWITLCAACHGRYSKRLSVDLLAEVRRIGSGQDGAAQEVRTVHAQAEDSPPASDEEATRAALLRLKPPIDRDVDALCRRVRVVCQAILLPEWGASPQDSFAQVGGLRTRYLAEKQRIQLSQPVSLSALWQLAEIDRALTRLEACIKLAEQTQQRVRKLMRQAKQLLDRTLRDPGVGYFYRRRIYRRLAREHDDLCSLVTIHNLRHELRPADWASTLSEMFSALSLRYGSPLSDAEIRRILCQFSPADIAPLASALQHCTCDICVSSRKNIAMETETYLTLLSNCPCPHCSFCRATLWKIDVTKLAKAPAYRDAMLLLRHRIGSPPALNK